MRILLRSSAASGLLFAALLSSGCQDMRAFISGDPLSLASADARRVELEVFVEFDQDFFSALDLQGDERDVEALFEERVLEFADLGLRFYPVATAEYRPGQVHPQRMMVVRFNGLTIGTEHEVIEEPEKDPRVESSVEEVRCKVTASIGKRRDNAPTLIVGRATGAGRVSARETEESEPSYALRTEGYENTPPVARRDLVAAVDRALIDALRDLIGPVDRELATAAREGEE